MSKVFIIAEAGVNHNGQEDMAFKLVDAAVDAGADAIKFQTFKTANLVSKTAPKAQYQLENTSKSESQQAMLEALELSEAAHIRLSKYCESKKIIFLSTPFDIESLKFLHHEINMERFKVASGEITNAPLLLEMARLNKPMILSTGMANLSEVEDALGIIAFGMTESETKQLPSLEAFKRAFKSHAGKKILEEKLTILHCTSYYPAPMDAINLNAIHTLCKHFSLPVGYSDHTLGMHIAIAAVANGASVIEKHITLDQALPGPDHKASIEPETFKTMVQQIRDIEQAMGDGVKKPHPIELDTKMVARKSIVAAKDLRKGQKLTLDMMATIRPEKGLSPTRIWDLEGKVLTKNIKQGECIDV